MFIRHVFLLQMKALLEQIVVVVVVVLLFCRINHAVQRDISVLVPLVLFLITNTTPQSFS